MIKIIMSELESTEIVLYTHTHYLGQVLFLDVCFSIFGFVLWEKQSVFTHRKCICVCNMKES